MKSRLIPLLAALAAPLCGATLPEAQQMLFAGNMDLAISASQELQAFSALREARGAFHPSLSVSGLYGYQSEAQTLSLDLPFLPPLEKEIGDHDRVEMGADLTLPLFTGFSRWNAMKIRSWEMRGLEARREALKQRLSFQLGMLYFSHELLQKKNDAQQALLAQLSDHLRNTRNLVEAGAAKSSRLSEAQARFASAQAERLAIRNQADSVRLEIINFIRSPDTGLAITPYGNAPDSAEIRRLLTLEPVADRPEFTAYDCSISQMESQKKAVAGRYWPSLSGSAGLRYGNPGLDLGGDGYMGWGVAAVALNWNLYEGMKTRSQERQAEEGLAMARLRKEKERLEWEKSVSLARLKLIQVQEQHAAALLSLSASDDLVKDLKDALDAGAATSLEYLNALSGQANARFLVDQSIFLMKAAALSLEYAAGKEIKF